MSEKDCTTCEHAVFELPFAEWKCMKRNFQGSVIVRPVDYRNCPDYKKGAVKERITDE